MCPAGMDATPVERILHRAEEETTAGRLWRAKEILRGAMRTHVTDIRILERYGRLLDRLGDRVEAGKYLFLSGVRGPDVDEAIQLFISRHGRGHLNDLIGQFPRRIRSGGLGDLPPVVEADLRELRLPASGGEAKSVAERAEEPGWRQTLSLLGCAIVGLILFVATTVGLVTIVRWLAGLAAQ